MTARPSSSLALAVGAGAVDAELGGVVVLRPPAGVLLRGERLPLRQAFDGILLQPVDSWGQPRNFVRSQKILEYEISLAIELIDLFLAQSHHSQKQLRARKFASRRSSRSTAAVGPSATIVERRGGRQQPGVGIRTYCTDVYIALIRRHESGITELIRRRVQWSCPFLSPFRHNFSEPRVRMGPKSTSFSSMRGLRVNVMCGTKTRFQAFCVG